jgi:hypothetical protein
MAGPLGEEIQRTLKGLIEERYNGNLSTANIWLLDTIYEAELPANMSFGTQEDADGEIQYGVPTVHAVINGVETEINIAEENNIETFWYDCLPTRIEDGETSYVYNKVVDASRIDDLGTLSPGSVLLSGHLYITISNNSSWEAESKNRVYFSKIILDGTLRKDVEEFTEAVPIRYNSTFRTLNQWDSITSLTSAYLSDDAIITIEPLPLAASSYLDKRNIHVPSDGEERFQFIRLGTRSWGSSLVVESYTSADMETVRLGYEEREALYEIELLDDNGNNVNLNALVPQPNTDFVFGISNTKFYVYDMGLPYPDLDNLSGESQDTRIEIGADRWTYSRGETAKIWTRLHSFANVPTSTRWTVTLPDDSSYYMGVDGSLWATTTDAWIDNDKWDEDVWDGHNIDITLTQAGTYTFELEAKYYDKTSGETSTRSSKMVILVPSINPEQELSLPASLQNCTNMAFDSDGQLWLYDGTRIHKTNLYYDYFMADYERRKILLREQYSLIKVVTE